MINPIGASAFSLKWIIKAGGVLLSALGGFFFFDKYQEVGLSLGLLPTAGLSIIMIIIGQYLFWRF